MKIYERIKHLRKNILKLTQEEFASALGISRSNIGNIEVGRINITDRVIQDICSKYSVSENWLKYGDGEILLKTPYTIADELKQEYSLDDMDVAIIEGYLNLSKEEKTAVKKYIRSISGLMSAPSREDIIKADIKLTEKELYEINHIIN